MMIVVLILWRFVLMILGGRGMFVMIGVLCRRFGKLPRFVINRLLCLFRRLIMVLHHLNC